MLRVVDAVTTVSGLGLALAQVPGIPEDFATWPTTAILGLITLASLSAGVIERRMAARALTGLATSVTRLATEQGVSNRRMDEVASKLGEANKVASDTLTNLKARPCVSLDLTKLLKERQRLRVDEEDAR